MQKTNSQKDSQSFTELYEAEMTARNIKRIKDLGPNFLDYLERKHCFIKY